MSLLKDLAGVAGFVLLGCTEFSTATTTTIRVRIVVDPMARSVRVFGRETNGV